MNIGQETTRVKGAKAGAAGRFAATLNGAARAFPGRRLVVAFQPHRYSRTQSLFDDFVGALRAVSPQGQLLLTEVYAAGEDPIDGVSGSRLASACGATFVARRTELAQALRATVEPGDLVITLGAGDITLVGDELLELLRKGAA